MSGFSPKPLVPRRDVDRRRLDRRSVGDGEHDQPGHSDGDRSAEHPEQHALGIGGRPAHACASSRAVGKRIPSETARSADSRGTTDHSAETRATERSATVASSTARGSKSPSRSLRRRAGREDEQYEEHSPAERLAGLPDGVHRARAAREREHGRSDRNGDDHSKGETSGRRGQDDGKDTGGSLRSPRVGPPDPERCAEDDEEPVPRLEEAEVEPACVDRRQHDGRDEQERPGRARCSGTPTGV